MYHDVWDRVPVCLATVPFAIGYERAGIPREHWRSGEAFPLEQNAALVSALNELIAARRVTIALHGYTHEDFPDGYRVPGGARPGAARARRAARICGDVAARRHFRVRAAAQRAFEARPGSRGRRRA